METRSRYFSWRFLSFPSSFHEPSMRMTPRSLLKADLQASASFPYIEDIRLCEILFALETLLRTIMTKPLVSSPGMRTSHTGLLSGAHSAISAVRYPDMRRYDSMNEPSGSSGL